jgi:hypothetical protein
MSRWIDGSTKKPATAKGWCLLMPSGRLMIEFNGTTKSATIKDLERRCHRDWAHWRKLGYRLVRFTATEVTK